MPRYLIPENGRFVEVTREAFEAHQAAQAVVTGVTVAPVVDPTVAELATNFAEALARWTLAGAPIVSAETYAARAAACETCEHWSSTARFGLGKCSAPGCGCTSLKRWLATEQCPLSKWRS